MIDYPIAAVPNIHELDIVVGMMLLLTLLHSIIHKQFGIVMAAFLGGFLVETGSIRGGGTHCHSPGIINFSHCSSGNSVLYILPWVYSCLTAARRLCGDRSSLMPAVCAGLFFGFCGVYELQGPSFGWWTWPDADGVHQRTLPKVIQLWQPHSPISDGVLKAVPHTIEALKDRVFGVPLSAPFYHMAMGWGFAVCTQYLPNNIWVLGLVAPSLGMIWDPPARLLSMASGCLFGEAAPVLMAVYLVMMMVVGTSNYKQQHVPRDILLFAIPLINTAYFCTVGKRNPGVITGPLQALVWGVGFCAILVNARACGLIGASPPIKNKKNN